MASRSLVLSNLYCQLRKCSPVFSSAVNRNFSALSQKNEVAVPRNYANHLWMRTKYDKSKAKSAAREENEEVSLQDMPCFIYNQTQFQDSDDETEGMSDVDKKTVVKISVQSMRADLLLKSGIGIARNKIEAAFYEGRIRVNGKKLLKKSHSCNVGDEIDYMKNEAPTNPDHVLISRVEILSATPKDESISVTMKRFKSLTVEKKE
jgi:hypothetical protein